MNKIISNYLHMAMALGLIFGVHTAFATQICKNNVSIKETTPSSDFTDNNDGTITHKTTGLMWKKCSEGLSGTACTTGAAVKKNWKEALETANSATFAGHNDWRLPNRLELSSIVERRCAAPAINESIFPNTSRSVYWSSSPYAGANDNAWAVEFWGGHGKSFNYKNKPYHVRLVRTK